MSANDGNPGPGGGGSGTAGNTAGVSSLRAFKPYTRFSLTPHLYTPITASTPTQLHHSSIQLSSINPHSLPTLHPVAAKITHVKTTNIEALMTGGTIKVAGGGGPGSSLSGTPISLNSGQPTTAASIRAIGAGGQSTQVRVVVPTGIMQTSMIKHIENATATGRTQITAIPAVPARTVSNASITVTRPVTQATYVPRPGVTATQMTSVGVAGGQRLVTPLRATSSTSVVPTATGLTTSGSFVRGTAVSRSAVSQPTTVISSATNTAWMAAPSGQVQLIRTIPHQSRQRIITTQGLTTAVANAGGAGVSVSGSVMTTTSTAAQVAQSQPSSSTIQAVAASQSAAHTQQPQAYVTVLPPRQHQATLVYSSNVGVGPTSQPISQPQQFNPNVSTGQRFAVATPITGGSATSSVVGGATTATRQIRPMTIGKSFSTTKLNTTSISLRPSNIQTMASTMATGSVVSSGAPTITTSPSVVAAPTRSTTGLTGNVPTGNVLTTANLPTTRIIQLQPPTSGTAPQLIGPTGRLATNVMLQPIIVNTSSGSKIGIRPPVTMTAKVQPSLTITQLGTIGKLPSGGAGSAGLGSQNVASIQTLSGGNNATSSLGGPVSSGSTITNSSGTTQLVNVSQPGQLMSAGGVVTSAATGTPGGATVVPLAITTRGAGANNILTGTITPIKNANGITVGKMMTQATSALDPNNVSTSNAPTSVFIHQRPSNNNSNTLGSGGGVSVSVSNAGSTNVVTSSAAGAFLPAGSTIYYESMPANSVQVSTGVLSLTTTTVTQSTISQAQMVNSSGNLAISSLPFVTHAGGSTTTFTVVPTSSGGRTIGQLQLPVSSAGAQLQAVPVRLNTGQPNGGDLNATAQLVQTTPGGQQLIIPAPQVGGQQPQHMVLPLQTSVKVTTGMSNNATVSGPGVQMSASTMVSSFLRKRDAEGSPIRAAKNLAPTLLSMGSSSVTSSGTSSATLVGAPSPAGSSISSSSYSVNSLQITGTNSALTTEALAKKDRAAAVSLTLSSRADSPASSDGSTTVSANSSPGIEQQMQDSNLVINRMSERSTEPNSTHFNPINELYSNHHHTGIISHNIHNTPVSTRTVSVSLEHPQIQSNVNSAQRLNGGTFDCTIRKKPRRSTNDSQHSVQSQASLSLPPPTGTAMGNNITNAAVATESYEQSNGLLLTAPTPQGGSDPGSSSTASSSNHRINNVMPVVGNKENAKPVEFVLRRPRNCSLLNTYKQTHKLANNHFQRYSDVKPRDERRPTVMDMANQTNVMAKINGWKVYHLRSQMEDMVENENSFYGKLEVMLKTLEKDKEKNPEVERVNELLKGNMQRSKIVVDGINEAQNQIMKIFDHKSHVADIITRCASKRNFKKREKF